MTVPDSYDTEKHAFVRIVSYWNGHKNAKFDVNEFENLVYGAKGSTSGRVNRFNYISINSTLACEPINPPPHGSLLRNVLDKVTSTKGAHSIMAA